MKYINIIFGILFILSAALQYNDPDPYLWIPIYLFPAVLCFQAARGIFYPRLYIFTIVILGIYALYLLLEPTGVISWATEHHAENIVQEMKATKPWIESTREFFGLLIIIVSMVINLVYSKKVRKGI